MKRIFIVLVLLAIICGQAAQAASTGTVGWAKTLPDNTELSKPIIGVVATTATDLLLGNVSYLQDPNRAGGILVDSVGVTGQMVSVTGIIKTSANGERYISGSILTSTGTGQLFTPLGLSNKAIVSTIGLKAEGMLASTWGTVTGSGMDDFGSPYLYIDDGSGLNDGTSDMWSGQKNKGLRVMSSYASSFEVGDYLKVSGPVGRESGWDGVSFPVIRECLSYTELIKPVAQAIGGNGRIYVVWGGDSCAEAYRVYSSNAETGIFSSVGICTATDCSFLDKPLPNGVTRWYKVAALSGKFEGPSSDPVFATTIEAAPTVEIDTLSVDTQGVLDITFSTTLGTGGTEIPMVSLDIDGEELWDDAPLGLNGAWCYDTSELPNGTHTVGVKVVGINANGQKYLGYATRSFTVSNAVSDLFVSEIADGVTPFKCSFDADYAWTITVRQNGTVLGQHSGTGREIDWSWDAATGSEGSAEVEISYTPVSQQSASRPVVMATASKSKYATFWITLKSLLAKKGEYQWAAWYARDQKLDSSGPWVYADLFFKKKFNTPFNGYNYILSQPSHWESIVLQYLEMDEYPAKISHVVWSGHSTIGGTMLNASPNSLQASAWIANFVGYGDWWHGVSPFKSYGSDSIKYKITALGPKLGNHAAWKNAGNGRGRPEITQMKRRLKFAVVFGCHSSRGTMPLALGIPKKQIKGTKCCFIGFNNPLWYPNPASNYARFLFESLEKGNTTGVAVNYANKAFAGIKGPVGRSNPMLFGDPDMTVGRYAP